MPVHDRLLWYVFAAAALGLLLPDAATRLHGLVPLMLAGQVAGIAFTLPAREFARVASRPWPPLAALAVQWICFPLVGLALWHLVPNSIVGQGALVVAVAPAEITSALLAVMAAGDGALAVTIMVGSLALSTILTPLWLAAVLGGTGRVDEGVLVTELAFSVLLPLGVGVGARTVWPAIAPYRSWFLDLAAISVVLVVFVGAGSARSILHGQLVAETVAVCLVLILVGAALGAGAGLLLGRQPAERRAILFPVGMREFGVATAVALVVVPAATGIAGLYGILLMAGSAALATRIRSSSASDRRTMD